MDIAQRSTGYTHEKLYKAKPLASFAALPYRQQEWVCFAEIITLDAAVEIFPDELPLSVNIRKTRSRPPRSVSTLELSYSSKPKKARQVPEPKEELKPRKSQDKEQVALMKSQQRELEKRRLAYRQYWLAHVKLPIEDSLIHLRKGVQRFGPADPAARQIHPPGNLWSGSSRSVHQLQQCREIHTDAFFIWCFLQSFSFSLRLSRFSLVALCEVLIDDAVYRLTGTIFAAILELLLPDIAASIEQQLLSADTEEVNFLKMNGKGAYASKRSIHKAVKSLRAELFLHRAVIANVGLSSESWWFLSVMAARFVSGIGKMDIKKDVFWNPLAEDNEDQQLLDTSWVTDAGLDRKEFTEVSPSSRCRILKVLIDRLVNTALFKRVVDIRGEANIRIAGELNSLDKEERKIQQRITAIQRMVESQSFDEGVTQDQVDNQLQFDLAARSNLSELREIGERALSDKYTLHWVPLGKDRHLSEYYNIPFAENTVVVHNRDLHSLGIYEGEQALESLICSMDVRGYREESLRKELESIKREDSAVRPEFCTTAADYENRLRSVEVKERESEALAKFNAKGEDSEFLLQTLSVAAKCTAALFQAWLDGDMSAFSINPSLCGRGGSVFKLQELQAEAETYLALASEYIDFKEGLEACRSNIKALTSDLDAHSLCKAMLKISDDFSTVPCYELYLWKDPSEKIAWSRILSDLSEKCEDFGEDIDDVVSGSTYAFSCQFCGKPFLSNIRLGMHLSRWCKLKPDDQTDNDAGSTDKSCVERVEKALLPSFPLLSAAKLVNPPTSLSITGPFACDACGKEYSLQTTLAAHRTRWCKGVPTAASKESEEIIEGPPYICRHCNKEVATSQGLTVHLSRWCPAKDYGPQMDLIAGFEDEAPVTQVDSAEGVLAGEITKVVSDDSDEDNIISGASLIHSVSFSGISAAAQWLGQCLHDISDELAEKIRVARRRKL